MLSRVADDIYWFGRYLQRAESTARLINVNTQLMLDLPKKIQFSWDSLVDIVGGQQDFRRLYDNAEETDVVRFLLLDDENPGSVITSLHRAREILRTTRDTMPRETWEKVNDLNLFVQGSGERVLSRRYRADFLARVMDQCLTVWGAIYASMTRDVAFQVLRIGSNLEQADMTTRIIDVRSTGLIQSAHGEELRPFDNIQWMSVLRSLAGLQLYRRDVRLRVTGPHVLRYLLQNRDFPRSVTHHFLRIEKLLPQLPNKRPVERALQRVKALTRDADIDALVESGLGDFMDEIQIGIGRLHQEIAGSYFSS